MLFLICSNPKCRFVVNLREGAQVLERSKLVIDECLSLRTVGLSERMRLLGSFL